MASDNNFKTFFYIACSMIIHTVTIFAITMSPYLQPMGGHLFTDGEGLQGDNGNHLNHLKAREVLEITVNSEPASIPTGKTTKPEINPVPNIPTEEAVLVKAEQPTIKKQTPKTVAKKEPVEKKKALKIQEQKVETVARQLPEKLPQQADPKNVEAPTTPEKDAELRKELAAYDSPIETESIKIPENKTNETAEKLTAQNQKTINEKIISEKAINKKTSNKEAFSDETFSEEIFNEDPEQKQNDLKFTDFADSEDIKGEPIVNKTVNKPTVNKIVDKPTTDKTVDKTLQTKEENSKETFAKATVPEEATSTATALDVAEAKIPASPSIATVTKNQSATGQSFASSGNSVSNKKAGTPNGAIRGLPVKVVRQNFLQLRQMPGNRPPSYPEQARIKYHEGSGQLKYLVTREGTVTDLVLTKSTGHSELDQAAMNSFRKYRFVPGQQGYTIHNFTFALKGSELPVRGRLRTTLNK